MALFIHGKIDANRYFVRIIFLTIAYSKDIHAK